MKHKEIWKPVLRDGLRYSKLLSMIQPKYYEIFFIYSNSHPQTKAY